MILKLVADPLAARPATAALPLLADRHRGRLPAGAGPARPSCCIGPAERADVIVDFTGLPAGTELYLINEGPDEPFGGGVPGTDFPAADPDTTGQVMKFVRRARSTSRRHVDATGRADAPPRSRRSGRRPTRGEVSLNEEDSSGASTAVRTDGEALLGTINDDGTPRHAFGLGRTDHREPGPAARPRSGRCTTSPRTPTRSTSTRCSSRSSTANRSRASAAGRRRPWETGYKDTVIAYPGEITRVKALFDQAGPLRLALPHRRARGQRDDAALHGRLSRTGSTPVPCPDPRSTTWHQTNLADRGPQARCARVRSPTSSYRRRRTRPPHNDRSGTAIDGIRSQAAMGVLLLANSLSCSDRLRSRACRCFVRRPDRNVAQVDVRAEEATRRRPRSCSSRRPVGWTGRVHQQSRGACHARAPRVPSETDAVFT